MPSRVLFRADANSELGHGHLIRSLSVARVLAGWGIKSTMAVASPSESISARIRSSGADILVLPNGPSCEKCRGSSVWCDDHQTADAKNCLKGSGEDRWDAIVVDHYKLSDRWERAVGRETGRVIAIDDLANRPHEVSTLVDHNWYGEGTPERYDALVDSETTLLLGPRYALLHPEYAEAKRERDPVLSPPEKVLVNFGGSDAGAQTLHAASALSEIDGVEVSIVLGSASSSSTELADVCERAGFRIHTELPNLVAVLSEVDLAVGAAGSSTWERLCLGVPAVVTTVNEEQSGVTKALAAAGITKWLGISSEVKIEDYREAIREAASGDSMQVPPIVDGYGAGRVALAVVGGSQDLSNRPATPADAASVVTAGVHGLGGPFVWRARASAFEDTTDASEVYEIIEVNGIPVGVKERVGLTESTVVDACCKAV